ncbi:MAG: ABC transporter substrate-binding protein [Bacteroidia bacterium]
MKRFATALLPAIITAGVWLSAAACGGDENTADTTLKAKGDVEYGGIFRMNELEDFRSLYPIELTEVSGYRIASQIYEGLVKYNQKDLSVMPGIARSWDQLDSSTRFVFHLRNDVYFHNDACFAPDGKGRKVVAADIKYCFDQLCITSPRNKQFQNTFKDRVAGANDCYDKKSNSVSGVTVVNDSTIEVKLLHPIPGFLNIIASAGCWIYPKEAIAKYGEDINDHNVGTGPFMQKVIKKSETVVLDRNPNYWMVDEWGNKLPYLDQLQFKFIKDKRAEILAFNTHDLDMIYRLPVEMSKEIMGELEEAKKRPNGFVLQSSPSLSITYYGFLCTQPPFDNTKVRQAFCYAIDRAQIADKILQGDAMAASYGIVPPCMNGYDSKSVTGFTFDAEKARKLMAEAGYPGGKGFPEITLQINSGGGDRNILTAEYVGSQLREVLNINVRIETVPFGQNLEAIESGKVQFWRIAWYADYPDPETFLTTLYGSHVPADAGEKSPLNTSRYISPRFDSLYSAAVNEANPAKRAQLFVMADQQAMNDAAIMPIYYEQNDRLVNKNVRGFDINQMELRDFTRVWFYKEKEGDKAADTAKK